VEPTLKHIEPTMKGTAMRRYIAMALLVLATASSRRSIAGQDVRPARPKPLLNVFIQIEDADQDQTGFRLYGVPTEIAATFILMNSGDAGPIVVDTAAFRQRAQVTLERQDSVRVNLRWLPERTLCELNRRGKPAPSRCPWDAGLVFLSSSR
jgi:hypothetical protein